MNDPSRRKALKNLVAGTAALSTAGVLSSYTNSQASISNQLKGNIRHSVCRWCYGSIPLEEFAAAVKEYGIAAIDLVGPKDWPVLKQYGLDSSMCNGAEINLVDGFNNPAFHEKLEKNYTEMIPLVAKSGYT